MRTIVSNIKSYFTKAYKNCNNYAWYNTYQLLSQDEIMEIWKYVQERKEIKMIILVNFVQVARPQRTWGDMPEWFRPANEYHYFSDNVYANAFLFGIFATMEVTNQEIDEAIKSFPPHVNIYILDKKTLMKLSR